jgi:formate hydrogenlyase subunit 6/NADH:ubiquinone oxidoreductase subunit I
MLGSSKLELNMNTSIYYFSGTGNSLFVAEELKKRLPNSILIPIVRELKNEECIPATQIIGLVFPTHGLTIPIPVNQFIMKLDVSKTKYIFAIGTRGGTVFKGFEKIDKILGKQDRRLDLAYLLTMPSNDPKMSYFENLKETEIVNNRNEILQKLDEIIQIIEKRGTYKVDKKDGVTVLENRVLNAILENFIPFMTHFLSPHIKKYFYVNENCIGCRICEKLCLSNKIFIRANKPYWKKNVTCYLCYSCLNYCPKNAIQIYSKIWMKSYTEEKDRYNHPYATVEQISGQK